jgi:hypothetical protein
MCNGNFSEQSIKFLAAKESGTDEYIRIYLSRDNSGTYIQDEYSTDKIGGGKWNHVYVVNYPDMLDVTRYALSFQYKDTPFSY